VDSFDLKCVEQTTQKDKTAIYTFAAWCKPWRFSLPSVLQLAKDYDLELFILLTDEENSKREVSAVDYLSRL